MSAGRYKARGVKPGVILSAPSIDLLGDAILEHCIEYDVTSYRFDLHGEMGFIDVRPATIPRTREVIRVVDRVTFPRGIPRRRRLCAQQPRNGYPGDLGFRSQCERSERKRA